MQEIRTHPFLFTPPVPGKAMEIRIEVPTTAKPEDLAEIGNLLRVTFEKDRDWDRELPWQYLDNPCGPAWYVNARSDDGELIGHYAVIPLSSFQDPKFKHYQIFLSLNTAIHPKAQGKGLFKATAGALYAHLQGLGPTVVLGVANANSVMGFTGSLGFYHLGRLTLKFFLPWQSPHLRTDRLLVTDTALLSWRAGRPGTRMLKDSHEGSLSRLVHHKGLPLEGLLIVGAPEDTLTPIRAPNRSPFSAPLRLYASSGQSVAGGIPVPERLRPSPLHYICRVLPDQNAAGLINHLNSRRFEFIDFDVL